MDTQWTASLIILIDGTPLDPVVGDLLLRWTLDTSVHLPDMFELTFRDPARNVVELGFFLPGTEIILSIDAGEGFPHPIMIGEVNAWELEFDEEGPKTTIRGFDLTNRLMRGKKVRTYQMMMASEIVEEILAENGIELNEIDPTDDIYQYKAQAGVTDWDFIQMLAMDNGYRAYMQNGVFRFSPIIPPIAGDVPGTLEFSLPTELVLGAGLVRLRSVVRSTEQVEDVTVMGWSPVEFAPVVGISPAEAIGTEMLTQPEELSSIEGANTFMSLYFATDDEDEAETKAAALGNQLAESYAEIEGESTGNPSLLAGVAINLSAAGEPFDGAYTLTSARHSYSPLTGYTTTFTASGWQDRTMLGLAKGPEIGSTPIPHRMPGVCSATVINCRDPEDQARVQVLFEWMGPEAISGWIRCAQVGASEAFGFLWIPEEGDEVLVAFEHGDPSKPVIIGSLYNVVMEAAPGPETIDEASGLINERQIRSRFQHNITFYDSEETSGIMIATGDEVQGIFLNMEEQSLSIYNLDGSLEIMGTDVIINAEGDLTLASEGELSISGASVNIEGEGDVTINGASIEIAGDADLSIDAPIVMING
ncbi:MAG TPA: VgrG-related protein [Acidimicrobiales bacterium]|nr:VgrG-related protein [Acidimicrobiales bacterium]